MKKEQALQLLFVIGLIYFVFRTSICFVLAYPNVPSVPIDILYLLFFLVTILIVHVILEYVEEMQSSSETNEL